MNVKELIKSLETEIQRETDSVEKNEQLLRLQEIGVS